MTKLERIIPNKDCGLMMVLLPPNYKSMKSVIPATENSYEVFQGEEEIVENFEEKYIDAVEKFERQYEERLINFLSELDIQAIVKTDRYSLPFKKEIKKNLKQSSYLNDAFDFRQILRPIVFELLKEGISKLRFYMFINVITPTIEGKGIKAYFENRPYIEYSFRYYA